MEMVSKAVPPALMVLSEKVFEIVGLDGETISMSAAVQVPALHDGAEFVFVTLAGGEITAVLVTWVWAWAADMDKRNRNGYTTSPIKRRAQPTVRNESIKERKALERSRKTF